jgi:hypothetical protein
VTPAGAASLLAGHVSSATRVYGVSLGTGVQIVVVPVGTVGSPTLRDGAVGVAGAAGAIGAPTERGASVGVGGAVASVGDPEGANSR